jgi:hypothetical protein
MSSTRESLCMCDLCRKRAEAYSRTEAFAAIRRAAAVARLHDHKHTEYCAEHGPSWTSPGQCEASAIRYAIRAAIGSDKA